MIYKDSTCTATQNTIASRHTRTMRLHHNIAISTSDHGHGKTTSCSMIILFTYQITMHCAWKLCERIMTTSRRTLRFIKDTEAMYCQEITASPACRRPACRHMLRNTSRPRTGKPSPHAPHGEFALLLIPNGPWKDIPCDYGVDLSLSNGYDAVLAFIDRLMKMAHVIPCMKDATASDFDRMFLDYVVHLHGLRDLIVSDNGVIHKY